MVWSLKQRYSIVHPMLQNSAKFFVIEETNTMRWKAHSLNLHKAETNGLIKSKQLPGFGRRRLSEELDEFLLWIIGRILVWVI